MYLFVLCTVFSLIFWKVTNTLIIKTRRTVLSSMKEALLSAVVTVLMFHGVVELGDYLTILNSETLL